ncbi:hypothetical protein HYALB_00007608 [Hymenoscyphus albidus]|uniref:Calcineurin-like phosphoesterase domain-containing protein n=1 Tax=Hymenoscyphus albidus TaxID=595503 RepID=A0A9N9LNY9_9HELO|nr:hypothetical protein HYALB_00007608 [Hymenoscyphus albidus]
MPPTYYSTSRSTRDHFVEPPSLLASTLARFPSEISVQIHRMCERSGIANGVSTRQRGLRRWRWGWRDWVNLPHALIAVWFVVLLWGERWVFQNAVEDCRWGNWERWPKEATPHHLILLADPQIIDPHSYPGRPWPLKELTMLHADNYMKRSYISLQKKLHPDTIFFLGDLFDGGREWKAAVGNVEDLTWANDQPPLKEGEEPPPKNFTWGQRFGEDFWLHEYDRFGRIFYKYWNLGGSEAGPGQRGRRIISSLPGNHDLGYGELIKIPIRDRFEGYFGEGNRVDVIANHTFVSIDSVSLGASESDHDTTEITKPVNEFLANAKVLKRKAVANELSYLAGRERIIKYSHGVEDLETADFNKMPSSDPGPDTPDLPTILLTHVPLYRNPGTPCGPLRERYPPAKPPPGQKTHVSPDERNALPVSRGYQYQTVLSESDSIKVIESIGNVQQVFSGDDHDYCEIIHPENKNRAREITVKAVSWCMGVRKPGFLMLSMWNPIGPDGRPLHSTPTGHGAAPTIPLTTETHLCLLPDQIGILIRYGILIGISLLALIIRAILTPILKLTPFAPPPQTYIESSLLPTTRSRTLSLSQQKTSTFSNSSTSSTTSKTLAPRTMGARTRPISPINGYGPNGYGIPHHQSLPLINHAGYFPSPEQELEDQMDFDDKKGGLVRKEANLTPLQKIWREFYMSFCRVVWVVVGVYAWLVWFYPE